MQTATYGIDAVFLVMYALTATWASPLFSGLLKKGLGPVPFSIEKYNFVTKTAEINSELG